MMMPAMAGPSRRPPLTMVELSAIALLRSSRPFTIRTMNDCRAGMSKELTTPWNTLSQTISATVMRPERVRPAIVKDCAAASACVISRTRLRSQRSAQTPATGPRTKEGIWLAKLVTPSSTDEPVRR